MTKGGALQGQWIYTARGGNVRNEVELERLTMRLLDTADDALHPTHSRLWLRKTER